MILANIFNLCNYISGKEITGNAFTPDQFNLVVLSVQDELKGEEFDAILKLKIQGDQKALSEYLLTSIFRPFVKEVNLNVGADGLVNLPTDYERFVSAFQTYNNGYRPVDIVSDEVFNARRASISYRADVHPFGKMTGLEVFIIPFDLKYLQFTYIYKCALPYQDYCQDATTLDIILMPAGSVISPTQVQDHFSLADSLGHGINPDVTRAGLVWDPNIQHAYDSLTKELVFEDWVHYRFISRILSKVGINLGEQQVSQWAELKIKEGK